MNNENNNMNNITPNSTNNLNQSIPSTQTSYQNMNQTISSNQSSPQPKTPAPVYYNSEPYTDDSINKIANFIRTCLFTFISIISFTIIFLLLIYPRIEDILQKVFFLQNVNLMDSSKIIEFIQNSKIYQLIDSIIFIFLLIIIILISIINNLKDSLISVFEIKKYFIFIAICTIILNFIFFTLTNDGVEENIDKLTRVKMQYEIEENDKVVEEMTSLISMYNMFKYVYIISPILTLSIAYPTIKKIVTKKNNNTDNNVLSNQVL